MREEGGVVWKLGRCADGERDMVVLAGGAAVEAAVATQEAAEGEMGGGNGDGRGHERVRRARAGGRDA